MYKEALVCTRLGKVAFGNKQWFLVADVIRLFGIALDFNTFFCAKRSIESKSIQQ